MPLSQDVFNALKGKLDSFIGDVREQKQIAGQSENGRALAVLHTDLQKSYAWLATQVLPDEDLSGGTEGK